MGSPVYSDESVAVAKEILPRVKVLHQAVVVKEPGRPDWVGVVYEDAENEEVCLRGQSDFFKAYGPGEGK